MPRLAQVDDEFQRAEFDKFTAPLLLLHGLWTGPWVWRAAASYLAHRGWNCHALAWRGGASSWPELLRRTQRATDELGAPVVVGHDLGALAALQLQRCRSAVAIAPLPSGAAAPRHPFAVSLARLLRRRETPTLPTGRKARLLLGLEIERLEPESSPWLEELRQIEIAAAPDEAPRLLLAGGDDVFLPRLAAERLAQRTGAEIKIYDGAGHDLPYGPRWQATAADLHRWLVQKLGPSLLLLRGDEDLRDD